MTIWFGVNREKTFPSLDVCFELETFSPLYALQETTVVVKWEKEARAERDVGGVCRRRAYRYVNINRSIFPLFTLLAFGRSV